MHACRLPLPLGARVVETEILPTVVRFHVARFDSPRSLDSTGPAMSPTISRVIPFALCLLGVPLCAQASRVVPASHETVEGNTTFTYPFGRAVGGIQVLADAANLSASANAFVSSVSFRPNGILTGGTSATGYSSAYKVTCWNTLTKAAGMTTTTAANIGTALPTVVFSGTLNLPNVGVSTVLPEPFAVAIPFSAIYPFDGTTYNLLMQVETVGTATPVGSWNVDAISISKTVITGVGVKVGTLCAYSGQSLAMTYGSTQAASAIPGGSITYPLTAVSTAAWPTVIAILAGTNASPGFPIDLSAVSMPGCFLHVDPIATQPILAGASSYPNVSWPIPPLSTLVGGSVYIQNLGLNTLSSLIGAVTTDAFAVTIGNSAAPYPLTVQSIFSTNLTTWSISGAGAFHPVLKFTGFFP